MSASGTAPEAAGTRAWASAGHFLLVDVDYTRILIHPVGDVAPDRSLLPIALSSPDRGPVDVPILVD